MSGPEVVFDLMLGLVESQLRLWHYGIASCYCIAHKTKHTPHTHTHTHTHTKLINGSIIPLTPIGE